MALETLIVTAAIAGILVLLARYYGDVADVFMAGMGRKRAIYAAELLRDALQGCPDAEILLHFPQTVTIDCAAGKVRVGGYEAEMPACTGGGSGKTFVVRHCVVQRTQ